MLKDTIGVIVSLVGGQGRICTDVNSFAESHISTLSQDHDAYFKPVTNRITWASLLLWSAVGCGSITLACATYHPRGVPTFVDL
jgi:hypothetical protein